jgi:hypothetical protein
MVHPVHDGVGSGIQVRRPLREPGKDKKELFPEGVHCEHFVRPVTVMKKGLGKEG